MLNDESGARGMGVQVHDLPTVTGLQLTCLLGGYGSLEWLTKQTSDITISGQTTEYSPHISLVFCSVAAEVLCVPHNISSVVS